MARLVAGLNLAGVDELAAHGRQPVVPGRYDQALDLFEAQRFALDREDRLAVDDAALVLCFAQRDLDGHRLIGQRPASQCGGELVPGLEARRRQRETVRNHAAF